jgi:hypothetical protein
MQTLLVIVVCVVVFMAVGHRSLQGAVQEHSITFRVQATGGWPW